MLPQRDTIRDERLQVLKDEMFTIFRGEAVRKYQDEGRIKRFDDRINLILQDIRRS